MTSQWRHHFKICLSGLRIRCFLLCLSIVVHRVRNTAANQAQTTELGGGGDRKKTKRRTRLTSAQPSCDLMQLHLLIHEPQREIHPQKLPDSRTMSVSDCNQTLKTMLHTLSIKVYISCHQLWFRLPLHITSVPFHVPFSMHRLAAEPFRTNPSLHSNNTMSPRLYLLPYFRPFMGVPRTGQSASASTL